MDIKQKLDRTLADGARQDTAGDTDEKSFYERVADNYARMEGAIAVLSDMRENTSSIYYGRFARTLGIGDKAGADRLASIWEDSLLRLVHPDDLQDKYLQELQFLGFILRQRPAVRDRFHLESELRMRDREGNYLAVRHRMFYILSRQSARPWLTLCLYQPMPTRLTARAVIVSSGDGQTTEISHTDTAALLSARERQVLQLIAEGLTSKEIASRLCISQYTVSRHRQNILLRLNVKNSTGAIRVAKGLKLF